MANNTPQLGMIISIFRDLALRHKMINDFIVGEKYDIGASNPLKFPYLWLSYDQSVISGAINSNAQTITYVMQVAVMDKIKKGDSNYDNILSDTHYILSTIISEMTQHQYYANLNIKLDGDIIFNAAQEFSDDNSNGWIATFRLKVPMRYTYCNSPIEPITGYQTSYKDGISTYRLQGAQGPQGFQGSIGFQGFQGFQGQIGLRGFQGSQGLQGFQGISGSNGFQGFQGSQGFQGPQGFQGNQGPDLDITQITGLKLGTSSWFGSSPNFGLTVSNSNILSTSIVEIIFDRADEDIAAAAQFYSQVDSSVGEFTIFARNIPTSEIGYTLNIYD